MDREATISDVAIVKNGRAKRAISLDGSRYYVTNRSPRDDRDLVILQNEIAIRQLIERTLAVRLHLLAQEVGVPVHSRYSVIPA